MEKRDKLVFGFWKVFFKSIAEFGIFVDFMDERLVGLIEHRGDHDRPYIAV